MARNFWSQKDNNQQDTAHQGAHYANERVQTTDMILQIAQSPLPMLEEVTMRIQQDYVDDPNGLADAQAKLDDIKLWIVDERYGNIVEIGEKTFSILHADSSSEDVRQGVKQYDNMTYIKAAHRLLDGNYEEPFTIERLLNKVDRKIFNNIVAAQEFVDAHVPGVTPERRVQNFALLTGLPKGGYCNPYGFWTNLKTLGYAWLSQPTEGMAGSLYYSKTEGGFFFHYLDLALPVICFKDANEQGYNYPGTAASETVTDSPIIDQQPVTNEKPLSDEEAYMRWSQGNSQQ